MRTLKAFLLPSALLLLAAGCAPTRADAEKAVVSHKLETLSAPALGDVVEVAFAQSATLVGCLWLERTDAGKGQLMFAVFDGSSWTAPSTVAKDVDLASASRRRLGLEAGPDRGWRAIWFSITGRGSQAVLVETFDQGKTWKPVQALSATIGAGTGPMAWMELYASLPSAGWIGEVPGSVPPLEAAFAAHPDAQGQAIEITKFQERAEPAADLSICRFHDHLLMAYRQLWPPSGSTTVERSSLHVDDLTRQNQSTPGVSGDGWTVPSGSHGVGPLLAARGDTVYLVACTKAGDPGLVVFRGGEIHEPNTIGTDPVRFFGDLITQQNGPPVRLPTFGEASGLQAHLTPEGTLVIVSLEEHRPVLRAVAKSGTAIERLGEAALDPSAALVWAGNWSGHEYLAWTTGQPSRLVFARLAD